MKFVSPLVLTGLLLLVIPSVTEACGGRGGRCRGHHHRQMVAAPVCSPVVMMVAPVASPTLSYATPQMAQAAPAASVAPVAAGAPVEVAPTQPAYEYAAAPNGQPAYYYTYDSSGKLIVAQWMDWVFRGGRAAGEPAPPLPIIGALRNRRD